METHQESAVEEVADRQADNAGTIILRAIKSKLGKRALQCPISGEKANWQVENEIVSIRAVQLLPESPSKGTYPMATVICLHCGYTFFINLFVLGVAEQLDLKARE